MRELSKYRNIVELKDAAANPRNNPRFAKRLAARLKRAKNPEAKARAEIMGMTPKFWLATESPDLPGIGRRDMLARWITHDDNKTAVRIGLSMCTFGCDGDLRRAGVDRGVAIADRRY